LEENVDLYGQIPMTTGENWITWHFVISPDIRVSKSRMKRAKHVASMQDLVEESEGKRLLGRLRDR
jgi:hypothetical protein